MPNITHLECSLCARQFEAGKIHNLCECGGALLVRYNLNSIRQTWNRDSLLAEPSTLWRYLPVLPARDRASIVTLGEGMTPVIPVPGLGQSLGAKQLWVKDEGLNPTGSSKPVA